MHPRCEEDNNHDKNLGKINFRKKGRTRITCSDVYNVDDDKLPKKKTSVCI